VAQDLDVPVLVSTHPRTRKRIEEHGLDVGDEIRLHDPLGFHDYVALQRDALCVISDSGTISEESAILGFPAVTIRDAIERPEAYDTGAIVATGLGPDDVVDAVSLVLDQFKAQGSANSPAEYDIADSSRRVLNFIRSSAATHHQRAGIRR
jgi:UDP-N-acetylglucosamine 2-epimerase (non-hydrolysing)